MSFDRYIGIDYSGGETPRSRTPALQVYATDTSAEPRAIPSPAAATATRLRNWCREEIAAWLIEQARAGCRYLAGLDHGFSFPGEYFERYGLSSWEEFLDDFCTHWPTDSPHTYVDFIREKHPLRTGSPTELRLTEQWTSSAKSVFHFDVQGQVAKSTHAGLPWLRRIRQAVGDRVHFWPFDGWSIPPGKAVLAEVYPSLVRNRYPRSNRTAHQQDAYAVARWLSESARRGILDRYFQPPLTENERAQAALEGWILGVS